MKIGKKKYESSDSKLRYCRQKRSSSKVIEARMTLLKPSDKNYSRKERPFLLSAAVGSTKINTEK